MTRIFILIALFASILGTTLNAADTKPMLTEKEAKALVASAKTPSDHLKLAGHYRQMSDKFLAESKNHEQMKAGYESNPIYTSNKFKTGTIDHCEYFVKTFREKAKMMLELAVLQEDMAKMADKK